MKKIKLTKKQLLALAEALGAKEFNGGIPKSSEMVAYSWNSTYGRKTAVLFIYGNKIGYSTVPYTF